MIRVQQRACSRTETRRGREAISTGVCKLSQEGLPPHSEMPERFKAVYVDTYFRSGTRTPGYIFLNLIKRWVHFLLEILPKRLLLLKAWNRNQPLPPTDPLFNQILPQSTTGNGFRGLGCTSRENTTRTGLGPRSALNARVQGSNWKHLEIWQLCNEENE